MPLSMAVRGPPLHMRSAPVLPQVAPAAQLQAAPVQAAPSLGLANGAVPVRTRSGSPAKRQGPSLPPPVPCDGAEERGAELAMPAAPWRSPPSASAVEVSLSSQVEHERLRQIRDMLQQENQQLQELVSRWQQAYEVLEAQHQETSGRLQESVELQLLQLQDEKRIHDGELSRLQQENTSLRDENAALQKRQAQLLDHGALLCKHNERLREVLLATRDAISMQALQPAVAAAAAVGGAVAAGASPTPLPPPTAGPTTITRYSMVPPKGVRRNALETLVKGIEQNQEFMETVLEQVNQDHARAESRNRLLEHELKRIERGSPPLGAVGGGLRASASAGCLGAPAPPRKGPAIPSGF